MESSVDACLRGKDLNVLLGMSELSSLQEEALERHRSGKRQSKMSGRNTLDGLSAKHGLRSVQDHAAQIGPVMDFIGSITESNPIWIGDPPPYGGSDWLSMAGAICRVELDLTSSDDGFGFCSQRDKYMLAKESGLEALMEESLVFAHVWGALEATITHLKLADASSHGFSGKIGRARYSLVRGFRNRFLVGPLIDLLADFDELVARTRFVRKQHHCSFKGPDSALRAVYPLRNRLAHGDLSFPRPSNSAEPDIGAAQIVRLGSHLVLISLQMLLLNAISPLTYCVKISEPLDCDADDDSVAEVSLLWWLYNLQWRTLNNPLQHVLPFDEPWIPRPFC